MRKFCRTCDLLSQSVGLGLTLNSEVLEYLQKTKTYFYGKVKAKYVLLVMLLKEIQALHVSLSFMLFRAKVFQVKLDNTLFR